MKTPTPLFLKLSLFLGDLIFFGLYLSGLYGIYLEFFLIYYLQFMGGLFIESNNYRAFVKSTKKSGSKVSAYAGSCLVNLSLVQLKLNYL